jgi:hypothetical protein
MITLGAQAVMQDKGGDALPVEPAGDLDAFMVSGQSAVSAAGADHECGAAVVGVCRGPGVEEGLIRVFGAFGQGGTLRPEGDLLRLRLLGVKGCAGEQRDEGDDGGLGGGHG